VLIMNYTRLLLA